MSGGSSSSSRSSSVKQRALHYLQKVKDVSKEIFRNLQTVSKTGRDEPGGAEKAETLRTQRENYIELLCSFQGALHESVGELDKVMECKRKMGGMKKKIEEHEMALCRFGKNLKSVEQILSDVLKRTSHEGHSSTSAEPIEIDIDDIISYSHVISYSTSAQEGWEPNTALMGALPPAPHTEMMARSRLFAASRPSRALETEGASGRESTRGNGGIGGAGGAARGNSQISDGRQALVLGKRAALEAESEEDEMLQIWSHPLLPADGIGAAEMHTDEMHRPPKRHAVVESLSACIRESPTKDKGGHDKGMGAGHIRDGAVDVHASENMAANLRQDSFIDMPKMPSWWRPGMPILVAPAEKN